MLWITAVAGFGSVLIWILLGVFVICCWSTNLKQRQIVNSYRDDPFRNRIDVAELAGPRQVIEVKVLHKSVHTQFQSIVNNLKVGCRNSTVKISN
jgi:hypothetical protein